MPNRDQYRTKQRELILTCLQRNQSQHITVEELLARLKEEGASIGQTTVYRNLDKLVKEGVVIRYTPPALGMSACYQYIGEREELLPGCHLVCTDCGQTTHLQCDYLHNLSEHMKNDHDFNLDHHKTVLYGLCKNCAGKSKRS